MVPLLLIAATLGASLAAVVGRREPPPPAACAPCSSGPSSPVTRDCLRPAPVISRGARVAASAPGARVLVDGVFRADSWGGGKASPEHPAWVSLRLPSCLRRVLLLWTSSHNHDYFEQFYGAPRDYRLELSADSTDGADGRWRTALEVKDNPARTRAHALDLDGARWVRLAVTRLPERVNEWGLFLDEIEVHDLSDGGDDVWIFLGDSIDAGVFDRAPDHQPDFARWVEAAWPRHQPVMIDAGLPRLRAWEASERVDEVLALNPDARVVAVTLGANDADLGKLRAALQAIVRKIRAAGKIPLLSRIPFQTKYGPDYVAAKNVVVDEVVREEGLLPGPDLYRYFKDHPERLHDGLHPDGPGAVAFQRAWAIAAAPLYQPPRREGSPQAPGR